jgi:hypothetical protein
VKTIELPCHGIVVRLGDIDQPTPTTYRAGAIESKLHNSVEPPEYAAAVDAVEAFVLAAAMAGIDIESPAFLEALEVTVDKLGNRYGD